MITIPIILGVIMLIVVLAFGITLWWAASGSPDVNGDPERDAGLSEWYDRNVLTPREHLRTIADTWRAAVNEYTRAGHEDIPPAFHKTDAAIIDSASHLPNYRVTNSDKTNVRPIRMQTPITTQSEY